MSNVLKNLSKKEKMAFFDALYYMNMAEIKMFCRKHKISLAGKKGSIIDRVKHFLLTGKSIQPKSMPVRSKAEHGKQYPLKTTTLILHGAYKNDLKTRNFFKSLVGKHFHFTAAGQDWISDRWYKGKPPTYAEFAKFWQQDYEVRKNSAANPRKEWAYLNFLQRYKKEHPNALRIEMTRAWKKTRAELAQKAKAVLDKVKKDG